MIFYDTMSLDQILIGRQYSVIGPNYTKNEEIVSIVDFSSTGRPIDNTGFVWSIHGFAEPICDHIITGQLSNSHIHHRYYKSLILNKLYRIIPI